MRYPNPFLHSNTSTVVNRSSDSVPGFVLADAQHGGGGGGGGGGGHQHVHYPPNFYLPDTQHHIDFEIEHIIIPSVGYQSHLCLDLLLVDCRTHVTVGDEMVCGTDGVTYANQ